VKLTKRLLEHKKIFLWLAIAWTAIVTFFCLVNFNELPTVGIKNFDKLGHMSFHIGITVFWFLYFKFQKSDTDKKSLVSAFLFSFFYGVGIELTQAFFTTTRKGDILDVCANTTGSGLAILVIVIVLNRIKSRSFN
jgi:VanZ family protein